jgi:hypothetical protein
MAFDKLIGGDIIEQPGNKLYQLTIRQPSAYSGLVSKDKWTLSGTGCIGSAVFVAPTTTSNWTQGDLCILLLINSGVIDLYNTTKGVYTKSIYSMGSSRSCQCPVLFVANSSIPNPQDPTGQETAYDEGDVCLLLPYDDNGGSNGLLNITKGKMITDLFPVGTQSSARKCAAVFVAPTTTSNWTQGDLCVVTFATRFSASIIGQRGERIDLINLTTGTSQKTAWIKSAMTSGKISMFVAPATVAGAYNEGDLCVLTGASLSVSLLNLTTGVSSVGKWSTPGGASAAYGAFMYQRRNSLKAVLPITNQPARGVVVDSSFLENNVILSGTNGALFTVPIVFPCEMGDLKACEEGYLYSNINGDIYYITRETTSNPVLLGQKTAAQIYTAIVFVAPATVAGAYNEGDLCVLMPRFNGGYQVDFLNVGPCPKLKIGNSEAGYISCFAAGNTAISEELKLSNATVLSCDYSSNHMMRW